MWKKTTSHLPASHPASLACRPLLFRSPALIPAPVVSRTLKTVSSWTNLPFPQFGYDSDNGGSVKNGSAKCSKSSRLAMLFSVNCGLNQTRPTPFWQLPCSTPRCISYVEENDFSPASRIPCFSCLPTSAVSLPCPHPCTC